MAETYLSEFLESDFVVMFFQLDMHGEFGLANVSGCAWFVVVAGAWCVVNH
jgi:hypothetical protein